MKLTVDLDALDDGIASGIREFMEENELEAPNTLRDALDMYLQWNGIIGYTDTILRAVRQLENAVGPSMASPKLKPVGPGRADELNEIIAQGQGRVWCNDYVDGAKRLSIWTTIIADGDHYIISGGTTIGSTPKRSHYNCFYIEE